MLNRFLPARKSEAKVFVDLDRMISEPIGFKIFGRVHQVRQMDTETFFKVANELASLDNYRKQDKIDVEEVADRYTKLFMTVCDTISKEDCKKMNPPQMGALFQQILDCVTGNAYRDTTEKKKLTVAKTLN